MPLTPNQKICQAIACVDQAQLCLMKLCAALNNDDVARDKAMHIGDSLDDLKEFLRDRIEDP